MDIRSTRETIARDKETVTHDREPVYENFMCVDNVSIFDHRVIGVIKRVNEAPLRIREETERFFNVIDNLKRVYIHSLAKRTKASKRYSKAVARYEHCEREIYDKLHHNSHGEQSGNFAYDDFTTPLNNTSIKTADQTESPTIDQHNQEKLDKCHVELLLARNILDSADRALEIHREQLCLFTKKAEHSLMCFLRKTTDMYLPQNTTVNRYSQKSKVDGNDSDDLRLLERSPLPPPRFLQLDDDEENITDSLAGSLSTPSPALDSGSEEMRKTSTSDEGEEEEDGCGFSGFEWDATFDDRLHTYQHLPLVGYHDTSITSDGEEADDDLYYDYDPDNDDDVMLIENKNDRNSDNSSNKTDYFQPAISANNNTAKLYSSEPLYDDLFFYRRRCALAQYIKPSRLMKYLKTVIHGPWEGWEDL